jgi:hypothetical protein
LFDLRREPTLDASQVNPSLCRDPKDQMFAASDVCATLPLTRGLSVHKLARIAAAACDIVMESPRWVKNDYGGRLTGASAVPQSA